MLMLWRRWRKAYTDIPEALPRSYARADVRGAPRRNGTRPQRLFRDRYRQLASRPHAQLCEPGTEDPHRAAVATAAARYWDPGASREAVLGTTPCSA
jgi:hypothetical protein